MEENPYDIGDQVMFVPNKHTIGWLQHSFERRGLYPGLKGAVTAIDDDIVVINGNPETGMHWSQFKRSTEVPEDERLRMVSEWRKKK